MIEGEGSDPLHRQLRRAMLRMGGVNLFGDLYERATSNGLSFPIFPDAKRRRRLTRIREAGALFVHIPKNAGMSISLALYGEQIFHSSIRYYQRFAPDVATLLPSFAVWRDPVDRFVSAYRFGQVGGAPANPVATPFRHQYRAFASFDEALDHIEEAPTIFALDHIFRPQFWYVADRAGRIAVDRLCLLDQLDQAIEEMALPGLRRIPHINESCVDATALTAQQVARLRSIYVIDFAIYDTLSNSALPAFVRTKRAA